MAAKNRPIINQFAVSLSSLLQLIETASFIFSHKVGAFGVGVCLVEQQLVFGLGSISTFSCLEAQQEEAAFGSTSAFFSLDAQPQEDVLSIDEADWLTFVA